MNNITITGRVTKDIELTQTRNGIACARFNVAVNGGKDGNGERLTDFFSCIAWRSAAETLAKYVKKGNPISVSGSMNSRKYTNADGFQQTIWELNIKDFTFMSEASRATSDEDFAPAQNTPKATKPKHVPYEQFEIVDEDLPF